MATSCCGSVAGAGDFGNQSLDFLAVGVKEGKFLFGHFHRAGVAQNREHLVFELHKFRTAHAAGGRNLVKQNVVAVKLKRPRGAIAAEVAREAVAGKKFQVLAGVDSDKITMAGVGGTAEAAAAANTIVFRQGDGSDGAHELSLIHI